MKILMGGSGSSGSTMLRSVFNRHPEIFSGAELNFFNKQQIFSEWEKCKPLLSVKRKVKPITTQGWFPYPNHNLLHEDYGWTHNELNNVLQDSESMEDFVDIFFKKPLQTHKKKIWIEKTPSNAYSFKHFLKTFPDGKVIHITRNPYDSVASLVKRKMSPFFATGIWVYNVSSALSARGLDHYLMIKYEDLITNPQDEIEKLFQDLSIDFYHDILENKKQQTFGKVESWKYSPDQPIQKHKVSTFDTLDSELKDLITTSLSVFNISDKHMEKNDLEFRNCKEICDHLGYEFVPQVKECYLKKLKKWMVVDFLKRSLLLYRTGWNNYPAKIVGKY